MKSPILNRVNAVFVHVDSLEASAVWYRRLFGLPAPDRPVEGPIHMIELESGIHFLLDDNRNTPKGSSLPTCMLLTPDVDEARRFLIERGAEIVREIERHPDVSFFNFRDPDGNTLMVCQQHHS